MSESLCSDPILDTLKRKLEGVLSGSMGSWGEEIMEDVEHVIFVDTPTDVRMKRLREREFIPHEERVQEGGDMHEESVKFLAWAYEDPSLEERRSRVRHEQWLREVRVQVTRLSEDQDELVVLKEALKAPKRDDERGREEEGWSQAAEDNGRPIFGVRATMRA
ncbi:hypothetical protein EG329_000762 [Mollisiaceae sp. DMI_Dod_QoI]|nr:hypothetical protein EG329_000762 [Helotiales sp. DMI_Dod_QoI]